MAKELNHIIIWSSDQKRSAAFLAEVLDLPVPTQFAHFDVVTVGGVSLDFADSEQPIKRQHYAFLISEEEFDGVLARIKACKIDYWADPLRKLSGQINHDDGGRGVYFADPTGHNMEVMTRPYARESVMNKNPEAVSRFLGKNK